MGNLDHSVQNQGGLLPADEREDRGRRGPKGGDRRRLPRQQPGVARLVEGMRAEDAIQKIQGIRCGYKATSCPDQLSKALQIALAEEAKRKQ